ncbi:MAG: CRISPR-associated helicase Cas3' [Proteobacteria bacterium]|nr:CRISPR-associated helicase Cas3' [Pseudomonadota bacterium]
MTNEYYAHSKEGKPRQEWQRLYDHLKEVSERAFQSAKKFRSEDWAWNAGWLHDMGKAADEFQAYLLRENDIDDSEYNGTDKGRINHSSAGAAYALDCFGPQMGLIYAYLAAGHHAGLPDYYSTDTGTASLQNRLEEGENNLIRIRSAADEFGKNTRRDIRLPPYVKKDNFNLWVRMIFSCLVDADYLDTESFMTPLSSENRGGYQRLPELKTLFDNHMTHMTKKDPEKPINVIRNYVLTACRNAAPQNSGLFSLSVPTGGGKTLSAMAFALDHAEKHGKDRIIYVIPYTSIIEQTAKILSDIFGAENIIEHHSNLDPEKETYRSRLASENWDAPVIVTTNVQFFESLYAAKPGRCRKLHNIINSVVILDEAQLLPPGLLEPCVNVINHLTRHFSVTLLLATATQPALPNLDNPHEIIPDRAQLYEQLKRTKTIFPKDLNAPSTWEEIAENLKKHDQVLCVVNTRRGCYDLFRLMPEGSIHLSALMCGEHRSAIIQKIKEDLKNGTPIRVISTQLVEAGVDIDFPVVYRALSGLDSIAQSGGRCNREGNLNKSGQLGEVHVFIPPKPAPRGLLRKGEDTTKELMSLSGFDSQQSDAFTRYFSLFYSRVNDTGSRFKEWLENEASPQVRVHFRTAAKEFNLIEDVSQPLFVKYGNSQIWMDELRRIGPTRNNVRKLQRYTVNVSKRDFEKMNSEGMVEELWPGFWAWLGPYDSCHGLDLFGRGWAPEDLVV